MVGDVVLVAEPTAHRGGSGHFPMGPPGQPKPSRADPDARCAASGTLAESPRALQLPCRPQAHGPHSGTVVPVVLKEPTPPPLLRLGQWASALQPGAERPDSLADVPGASV